jgi:hypothetical protein
VNNPDRRQDSSRIEPQYQVIVADRFRGAIAVYVGLAVVTFYWFGLVLLPTAAFGVLLMLVQSSDALFGVVALCAGMVLIPWGGLVGLSFALPAYVGLVRRGGIVGERWHLMTFQVVMTEVALHKRTLWSDLERFRRFFRG